MIDRCNQNHNGGAPGRQNLRVQISAALKKQPPAEISAIAKFARLGNALFTRKYKLPTQNFCEANLKLNSQKFEPRKKPRYTVNHKGSQ